MWCSPEVVIGNATHPLEQVEPSVLLNINYNSTRKCVGLRLGYQKRGLIPQLRLSNIHPEGGTVPCIEAEKVPSSDGRDSREW